jgi:ribosomal protein S18 acetylase RimI-like enzyme
MAAVHLTAMDELKAVIRPATAGDTEVLAALCGVLGYPTTAGDAARRFAVLAADPGHVVFVAEAPELGRVVGFIHVYEYVLLETDPMAQLGGLAVDPQTRRRGIGAALFAAACEWARVRGLAELRIKVGTERDAAHDFYPAAGCRRVKSQHVYAIDLGAGAGA